jgi:ATP-binding cassette subfamily B protein RaxB
MCGLYNSVDGEVLFDGLPITLWGRQALRRKIGIVLQDDELLSGTIAENVAFFDPHVDIGRVWKCLEMTQVADEIRAMPLGADTEIGDMGSTLSGGQKQRVLLARALYREPRALILDEATSHLDVPSERRILQALQGLSITRIVVTHRPDTIISADRIFRLGEGVLREVTRAELARAG